MADATIFESLKRDHDQHRQLLNKLAENPDDEDRRSKLFEQFRVEVTAHGAAEEETLYATMLAEPDLREDAQHSVFEHKEIDDFFDEMDECAFASSEWEDLFAQMKRRYLHHIQEEEDEMFPDAAKELSPEQAEKLASKFAERKPDELERAAAE